MQYYRRNYVHKRKHADRKKKSDVTYVFMSIIFFSVLCIAVIMVVLKLLKTNVSGPTSTSTPVFKIMSTTPSIMLKSLLSTEHVTTTAQPVTISPSTTIQPTIQPFFTTQSPILTTNLMVWLDATNKSSWTGTQWINLSPNSSRHATSYYGTWSLSDLTSNVINGSPGLLFDGSKALSIADPAGTYSNGVTLFMVFKVLSTNIDMRLISRSKNGVVAPFSIFNDIRQIGNGVNQQSYINATNLSLNTLSTSLPYIVGLRIHPKDPLFPTYLYSYVYWLNSTRFGTYINASTAADYSDIATALYIGTNDNSTKAFNAYMGEVITYNSAITDAQAEIIIQYLKTKWKII